MKFKARIVTEDQQIHLRSSGEHSPTLKGKRKTLEFSDVEPWDTKGEVPTLIELAQHFDLPEISTVMNTHLQYLIQLPSFLPSFPFHSLHSFSFLSFLSFLSFRFIPSPLFASLRSHSVRSRSVRSLIIGKVRQ